MYVVESVYLEIFFLYWFLPFAVCWFEPNHISFGRSKLVGQRLMKSLAFIRPSVTKFCQDWIISLADHNIQ